MNIYNDDSQKVNNSETVNIFLVLLLNLMNCALKEYTVKNKR